MSKLPVSPTMTQPPRGLLAIREAPTWKAYQAAAPALLAEDQFITAVEVFDRLKGAFLYTPDPGSDIWDSGRFATIRGVFRDRQVFRGDCEDFAFEALRRALAAGIAMGAMRIVVCRLPDHRGHAVLAFEAADRTLVADCLRPTLRPWDAPDFAGYQWIAASQPGQWPWLRIGGR